MKKLLIAALCVLLVSCCTFNFNVNSDSKQSGYDPHDALMGVAMVTVRTIDKRGSLSGSAWAIDQHHLITAGHVCSGIVEGQASGDLEDDIQLVYYKNHNYTKGTLHGAKIDAIDTKNDICLLGFDNHGLDPIKLAKKIAKVTDKIWIVGAPMGIMSSVAAGEVMSIGEDFGPDFPDKFVVDAQAAPGNSGSVVIDKDGNAVGMLIAGAGEYDHLSICTKLGKIYYFYNHNKNK